MNQPEKPVTRVILNESGVLCVNTKPSFIKYDNVEVDNCCSCCPQYSEPIERVAFVSSIGQNGLNEERLINKFNARPGASKFPKRDQLTDYGGILCSRKSSIFSPSTGNEQLSIHWLDLNTSGSRFLLDQRLVEFCWRVSSTVLVIVDDKSYEKLCTSLSALPTIKNPGRPKSGAFVFFRTRKSKYQFQTGQWMTYAQFANGAQYDPEAKSILTLLEIAYSRFSDIKIGFSSNNGNDLSFEARNLLNDIRPLEVGGRACQPTDIEKVFLDTRNAMNDKYGSGGNHGGNPSTSLRSTGTVVTQEPKRCHNQEGSERSPLVLFDQVSYNAAKATREAPILSEKEPRYLLELYENYLKSATSQSFFSNENFRKMNDEILSRLNANANPSIKLILGNKKVQIQLEQLVDSYHKQNVDNMNKLQGQQRKDLSFSANAVRSLAKQIPELSPRDLVLGAWELFHLKTKDQPLAALYEEEAALTIQGEVADLVETGIDSMPAVSEFRNRALTMLETEQLRVRITQLLEFLDEAGKLPPNVKNEPEILPENVTLEALSKLISRVDQWLQAGTPRASALEGYVSNQQEEAKALLTQSNVPLPRIRKYIQQHTVLIEELEERE